MADAETLDLRKYTGPALVGLLVVSLVVLHFAKVDLLFWLLVVVLLSVAIWRACEPLSDASFYLGRNVPGSVRGATIDAVASSMPEFFATFFFLFMYNQYDSGVATCAGSAIFNMMLIPALCVLFIYGYRVKRNEPPELEVEKPVIFRDGLYFVICEAVLIVFLFMGKLTWWMGAVFIALYLIYLGWLWLDARKHQRPLTEEEKSHVCALCDRLHAAVEARDAAALAQVWQGFGDSAEAGELDEDPDAFWDKLAGHMIQRPEGCSSSGAGRTSLCDPRNQGTEGVTVDFLAGERKGLLRLALDQADGGWQVAQMETHEYTKGGAWATIAIATLVVAVSCNFLAKSCIEIAGILHILPYFVAVILAAAATSVPDTFLSLISARKGDDSGAVSNAFGSNIFDVNICLGLPILLWTLMNQKPIDISQAGVRELPIALVILSAATLFIFSHKYRLTRFKGWLLIGLYGLFIAYAVTRGLSLPAQ